MNWARIIVVIALVPIIAIFIREIYLYEHRSLKDAVSRAVTSFDEECSQMNIDCSKLKGPEYVGEWKDTYKFRWTNQHDNEVFFVEVSYLPVRSERWYWGSKE